MKEEDPSSSIRSVGCVFSGAAAMAFLAITVFLLGWGWTWSHARWERGDMAIDLVCGWTYLIGSMVFFRVRVPYFWMVAAGVLLNAVGAWVWLPGWRYLMQGGWVMGLAGLGLLICWVTLVHRENQTRKDAKAVAILPGAVGE